MNVIHTFDFRIEEIFKKNVIDINRNSTRNGNYLRAISVQMCIVEILKVLDLLPILILDEYTHGMIQAYPSLKKTLYSLQVQIDFNNITSGSMVLHLCDSNQAFVKEPVSFLEFIGR